MEQMLKDSMAKINTPSEEETVRRLTEMDTTVTMIGEHLSGGILKGGAVNPEELKASIPFLDKCIPMLEHQIKLVGASFAKLSKEDQDKHGKTIESAMKTIKLLTSLKALEAQTGVAQCS